MTAYHRKGSLVQFSQKKTARDLSTLKKPFETKLKMSQKETPNTKLSCKSVVKTSDVKGLMDPCLIRIERQMAALVPHKACLFVQNKLTLV